MLHLVGTAGLIESLNIISPSSLGFGDSVHDALRELADNLVREVSGSKSRIARNGMSISGGKLLAGSAYPTWKSNTLTFNEDLISFLTRRVNVLGASLL